MKKLNQLLTLLLFLNITSCGNNCDFPDEFCPKYGTYENVMIEYTAVSHSNGVSREYDSTFFAQDIQIIRVEENMRIDSFWLGGPVGWFNDVQGEAVTDFWHFEEPNILISGNFPTYDTIEGNTYYTLEVDGEHITLIRNFDNFLNGQGGASTHTLTATKK